MKRSPMNRVSVRPRRKANPYMPVDVEVVAPVRVSSKAPREPWRLKCGVMWPVHYVPEEPMKGEPTYFRKMVEDLAAVLGWETHHVHVSLLDKPGMPDLFMIPMRQNLLAAGKRSMWRELKVRDRDGAPNRLSRHQRAFLHGVVLSGGDAESWLYPDDWFSGRIDRELMA